MGRTLGSPGRWPDPAGGQPRPRVSLIVPVRNEERYVERCLSRLLSQDYPADLLEILVVDCQSEDRTREIIRGVQGRAAMPPVLRLIDDPGRERTTALNLGIRASTGDVIMRVDARSIVPLDYVRKCVETLVATGADNVGGIQQPVAESPMQEAIGLAMSHPFGAGDAQFRVGKSSGFVDTVYLGSFRREVFRRVGLFDDIVPVLSEDSDINQRIRDHGGKVYLNTEIRAGYYPRDTLPDLIALYFRYGVARAGNVWKHRRLSAWRQAVPPLLVLALVTLGALAPVHEIAGWGFAIVAGAYVLTDVGVGTILSARGGRWRLWPRLLAVFPCMHFAWALGFFRGLIAGLGRGVRRRPRQSKGLSGPAPPHPGR
jgi:succinoglycan biosynthesis protein ExoA